MGICFRGLYPVFSCSSKKRLNEATSLRTVDGRSESRILSIFENLARDIPDLREYASTLGGPLDER
jgi:hypothetical protein